MKPFLNKDFLLTNKTACKLYHEYAEVMPIIDYHCHLSPREIYEDKMYDNITQLWLGSDHYKWRLMRANGVAERYISGNSDDFEKFVKWAETLEKAIGNPLYHWSHLELQRYFGFQGCLNSDSVRDVWDKCNQKIQAGCITPRYLMEQSNVKVVCTTDDPADTLEWHRKIQEDTSFEIQVLPTWRPDRAMSIENTAFTEYIKDLGVLCNKEINDFTTLIEVLQERMDYFTAHGCKIADHGLDYVMFAAHNQNIIADIFKKRLAGVQLTDEEVRQYKTAFMIALAKAYKKRNWVMQLHYGCKRNNNTVKYGQIGADTGFDCMHNNTPADQIIYFLDELNMTYDLPKTILYSLNPNDNAVIDTIVGCFQDTDAAGKVQHGSAWWFNDHKTGMIDQLTSIGNLGLLGNFIGMLTDSRSFLSYVRHEYFRRILCDLIGTWVENGEFPEDYIRLEQIVKDISYYNAVRYFEFNLELE